MTQEGKAGQRTLRSLAEGESGIVRLHAQLIEDHKALIGGVYTLQATIYIRGAMSYEAISLLTEKYVAVNGWAMNYQATFEKEETHE